MAAPRYAHKFTNAAGTIELTFPTNRLEFEESYPLRSTSQIMAGSSYAYRLLGNSAPYKAVADIRIRFLVVDTTETGIDTAIDALKQKSLGVGFGKLWSIGADASLRWCWAEVKEGPSIIVTAGRNLIVPSGLSFARFTDWADDTLTEEGEAINADPDTITISNAGNAKVFDAIITIRGTFTNPSIVNTTNGYHFSSTRDGSAAAHWLKIDCGKGTVQFSTDSGVTYADDKALFSRGTDQVNFMVLEVGDNTWEIDGCNGATIDVDFYPKYH